MSVPPTGPDGLIRCGCCGVHRKPAKFGKATYVFWTSFEYPHEYREELCHRCNRLIYHLQSSQSRGTHSSEFVWMAHRLYTIGVNTLADTIKFLQRALGVRCGWIHAPSDVSTDVVAAVRACIQFERNWLLRAPDPFGGVDMSDIPSPFAGGGAAGHCNYSRMYRKFSRIEDAALAERIYQECRRVAYYFFFIVHWDMAKTSRFIDDVNRAATGAPHPKPKRGSYRAPPMVEELGKKSDLPIKTEEDYLEFMADKCWSGVVV